MKPVDNKIYKIFFWLIIASFLTLIIFSSSFSAFVVPKTLFFCAIVEFTLPFYLYQCLKYYGFSHLNNPVVYLSAAFLAASFISGLVGVDFIRSFWGNFERMQGLYLSLHVFLWMLYLILLFKTDRTKIDLVIKLVIGIGVFASIIGIMQQFQIIPKDQFFPRSTSIFDNPIFFAAFLVIPFFLCLYRAEKIRDKWRWYFGFAAIILMGVITTKTAGADLGLAAGLATMIIIYFFDRKNIRGVIAVGSVLVVLALGFGFAVVRFPQLRNKFLGSDAQERIIQWGTSWRGFIGKPVFGVGPENYNYISNKFTDVRIYTYISDFFDKPHNYILEVLTTRGAVGLILYIGTATAVAWGFYRQYRTGRLSKIQTAILTGALVGYFTQNFFAFDMFGGLLTLTLLYAIAALNWESEDTIPEYRSVYINSGLTLATAIFIFLTFINVTIARANIYLTNGIKYQQADPKLSENNFERLLDFPVYADREGIDLAYESFINQIPQQDNSNAKFTISDYESWMNKSIDYNQKVINREPRYLQTQLSLARLYLTKSQIYNSVDPKIYEISAQAKQLAPNRIEADLILATIDTYADKIDQAQEIMDRVQKIAPNNTDVIWGQVYIYAESGQARKVLDRAKQIISKNLDAQSIAQLDRFASFYVNESYYGPAEELYNDVIMVYPTNGYLYVQLAKTYSEAGDKTNAQHIIDTLKQKDFATYEQYQDQIDNFLKPSTLQVR